MITASDEVIENRGDGMISSDVLRGYNDTMILCLLREKESYGYEIEREIEQYSKGIYSMKETTLYSAFARLLKNGYIVSYSGSETYGRPRTYFRITDSGLQYYREKCAEWELTKQLIDRFTQNCEKKQGGNGS